VLLFGGLSWAGELEDNFIFGSYGRIGIASDAEGRKGRSSQIVPFGPRLTQGNYLELDLGYWTYRGVDAQVRTLITTAYGDALFHESGEWQSAYAVRQAFVEAEKLFGTGAFLWFGSRMYRGDDVYLLDFWPMDEQNTVGGAVGWRVKDADLCLHMGLNRLEDRFQFQTITAPGIRGFGEEVIYLDRQRFISSLLLEKRFGGRRRALGMKLKLYGELHSLPSGRESLSDSIEEEWPHPDDRGWLLGAQLGLWNFARNSHLNLWLRYASGLAVYDELAIPTSLNLDRRAVDNSELRIAFSSNWETARFGLLAGGYLRIFEDGDGEEEDFEDRQEGAIALRPQLFWGKLTPALEASLQFSRPNGLNPDTLKQETAQVVQLGFIPAITFSDRPGSYSRPQVRLIYSVSWLNQAALDLYPAEGDFRRREGTVHYIGAQTEWWFGRGGGY